MCCRGKLEITGPLEVSVPRVPASSHQGGRELGTCKNLARKPNANGAWPLHLKKQEVAGKARKTKRVSEADWVSAAGS